LIGEVLMHQPHAHGAFSSSRRDALRRLASDIADGEDPGKSGLEREARRSFF
jgi:hypothetical protein